MNIKKLSVLFALASLICTNVSADFISQEKAYTIASDFFRTNQNVANSPQRSGIAQSATDDVVLVYPAAATRGNVMEQELPSFYIFNRTDGNGFVIVSAETGTKPVLAYSDEGIFHTDQMDRGARPFLDSYRQMVSDIRAGLVQGQLLENTKAKPSLDGIKTLKTANFDQSGYSFNSKYAPQINGESCLAGCVATAMSIIMKYYNWPKHNSGKFGYLSSKGLRLDFDFAANPFDWDSMSDNPDSLSSDAISMLQKACGIAVRMEYQTDGSAALLMTGSYALRHYFYYDYPMHLFRENYSTQEWEALMRSEIDAERPVLLGGDSSYGGHAYVLDGYNQEGIFHYNLGWGGTNNGFYSDGYISGDRFTNSDAVIGIKPRSNDEEDYTSPLEYSGIDYTFEGNLVANSIFDFIGENIFNYSNETFYGMLGVNIYDKDFILKDSICMTYNVSDNPLKPGWGWGSLTFGHCFINEGLSIEPTDMVMFSTSTDNGKTWKPVFSNYPIFDIRYAGGYSDDAPVMSQIMAESGTDKPTMAIKDSIMQSGSPFELIFNNIYNFTNKTFDGDYLLSVCDTTDWSVVYVLESDTNQCEPYYGARQLTYKDVIIPADLNLKPSYALALFTRASDSEAVLPVLSTDYERVYLKLSDYMDITDGIIGSMSGPEKVIIYDINGRRVQTDAATHGLYLIQHEDGTVTKSYR